MKNISFLIIVILLGITSTSYAEQITLTTYYPAPAGVYDRLRLAPRSKLVGDCSVGMLYVNKKDNLPHYCFNADLENENGQWQGLVLDDTVKELKHNIDVLSIKVEDLDTRLQVFMMDAEAAFNRFDTVINEIRQVQKDDYQKLKKEITRMEDLNNKAIKSLEDQIEILQRQIRNRK